ncbi:MAG: SGNH/GDSL hydrolase family protein, partial [Bacteroidales bacterium]|nr:SGNH/GDSL hydrolase family protein [Bacteroidales bacterium]
MKRIVTILSILALVLTSALDTDAKGKDWVTTWATALQIAEPHNNPPEPYLAGNSFRQTLQVSIAG